MHQFPFERCPRRYGQPALEEVGTSGESVQSLQICNGYTNVEEFLDGLECLPQLSYIVRTFEIAAVTRLVARFKGVSIH
jgi:hypothetical protein